MKQLTHHTTSFKKKQFPISIVCDEVYFQENIGSIFRICDAFGVKKIYFTGKNFIFSERKINKTSRSTHKRIDYEIINNKDSFIESLNNSDSEIIALEITSTSKPIQSIGVTNKPIILIIGNEINGISEEMLKIAKNCYHIEMFGENSSMNVVQSLAIALFQVTNLF